MKLDGGRPFLKVDGSAPQGLWVSARRFRELTGIYVLDPSCRAATLVDRQHEATA